MRRYRLYFGRSMKSFHTMDAALDWADLNLTDCPANLYDFDEYLCTI